MAELELPDELIVKLRDLARKEQRSVGDLITEMLQNYKPTQSASAFKALPDETPAHNPLIGLIGLLDEFTQETNLSSMNG